MSSIFEKEKRHPLKLSSRKTLGLFESQFTLTKSNEGFKDILRWLNLLQHQQLVLLLLLLLLMRGFLGTEI